MSADEGDMLLATGFEQAFIGVGTQFTKALAVYDLEKMIEILMKRDGMSHDEAEEFIEFNVTGAWVGEMTPVFLRRVGLAEVLEELDSQGVQTDESQKAT